MKDMEHAVRILLRSIQEEKRIAVYGDYDVDGVTATALLLSVLEQLGAELTYYLPDRLQEWIRFKSCCTRIFEKQRYCHYRDS